MGSKHGDDLLREYNEAEIFVLPSLGESQGIVFMEAMSCSLPVVGFNIGGVNEMIRTGEEGMLVEKENILHLASAIQKLMSVDVLRNKMGVKGRKRVEKEYQWSKIAELTENIYNKLKLEADNLAVSYLR